jgi:hypothetical protein
MGNGPHEGDPPAPHAEEAAEPVGQARSQMGRQAKLEWIRKASAAELAIPQARDALIREAVEAGATPQEVDEALDAPRWPE